MKAPTGWKGQSARHSNARRFGHAGGNYKTQYFSVKKTLNSPTITKEALRAVDYTIFELEEKIYKAETTISRGNKNMDEANLYGRDRVDYPLQHDVVMAMTELPELKKKLRMAREARETLLAHKN